jgi:opacity protein-like surface antigen
MRKLGMLLLGSMLAAAAMPSVGAAKGVSVSVTGGTIIPSGTFGDKNKIGAKVGYQVGGTLEYELNKSFAIGVDGSLNKDKGQLDGEVIDLGGGDVEKVDKAEFTTLQAGVHGKYLIPVTGPFRPYALLGLGLYRTEYKEEGNDTIGGVTTPFSTDLATGKRFGGKLGVGGTWSLSDMWAIGAEADYNVFTSDKKKNFQVSSLQYAGITAGLTLKVPMSGK